MRNSRSASRRTFQSPRGNSRSSIGNVFPRERFSAEDVAKGQAEVLQGYFGNLKSPAKEMARETGLNERACRNQIAGLNCMNLADFFNSCRAIPELQQWGMEMMGAVQRGDRGRVAELMEGHRAITLRIEASGVTLKGDGE